MPTSTHTTVTLIQKEKKKSGTVAWKCLLVYMFIYGQGHHVFLIMGTEAENVQVKSLLLL